MGKRFSLHKQKARSLPAYAHGTRVERCCGCTAGTLDEKLQRGGKLQVNKARGT